MKTNEQIAQETAKAAVEEATKAEPAPHVPRLPQVIQLNDFERIQAENLNLRMRLLETEYKAARQTILDQDRAWTSAVSQRLGVDLTKYTLDFSSGTGVLLTPQLAEAIGGNVKPKVN